MAKRHLHEIDLMRTFVMLGVLSVHTFDVYLGYLPPHSAVLNALRAFHGSLRFTREAFMFVTGLVLFVTYYHREFHPLQFWRKRILLVAVPYVVWTCVDIVGMESRHPQTFQFVPIMSKVVHHLLIGDGFFLYYLLVSMQLYVIFPALLYGVRKFEKWHPQILVGSLLFELLLMAFYFYGLNHLNWKQDLPTVLSGLLAHRGTLVVTYEFWFVAGGVLACHYQQNSKLLSTSPRATVGWICHRFEFSFR